jgi:exodeoxyribonuclease V alpha subunit
MKQEARSSGGEVLAGLVERVTCHDADNGFSVLRIKARGHRELVTVVGTPPRSPPASGSPRQANG